MSADDRLKVYITGATTAPGLALVRGLVARDHHVAGSARTLAEAKRLRATGALPVYIDENSETDLAGALRMTGSTLLVHAAHQAANNLLPDACQLAAAAASLGAGTRALLRAASRIEGAFVVHCSFACLYGDARGEAVTEDMEMAGEGALAEAAAAAGHCVMEAEQGACELRAGLLYGPDSEWLAGLRESLLDGGGLPAGIGDNMASWLHHDDLALAVALAAEQRPAGKTFNVVDDRPETRRKFLDLFAQSMGLAPPRTSRLKSLAALLPRAAGDAGLFARAFGASNADIRSGLGWAPQYPTVDSGLEQTLLTWRAAAARA